VVALLEWDQLDLAGERYVGNCRMGSHDGELVTVDAREADRKPTFAASSR